METPNKLESVQTWAALALTAGEFGTALWLVIHDGHFFALYLAVTYLMRETHGGKHYHEVVIAGIQKVVMKRRARACAPTAAHVRTREDLH